MWFSGGGRVGWPGVPESSEDEGISWRRGGGGG